MQHRDVIGVCSACGATLDAEAEANYVCAACAFAQALEPQFIGPYRLLLKIGEGGMGEVWQAEQTEPIKRRIALKVIKAGMDTNQVIARFEAERQALAVMDHPSVSKVLEAGSTDAGRPYFVMEFVKGLPITEHCDRHALTTRERLTMFLGVCDGVQHAHQKAIIHRDLKPSNVLVSWQDGVAVPKIIDFGVAKAIEQRLTEKSLFTEVGAVIGTPEYMSPEQADPAQDVDTRTDVYSLGVMLYELLVGALPFESSAVRDAGIDGLRRMIRELEPAKPSSRLGKVGGERSLEAAGRRGVDLRTLRRQLLGELDWITMKALEKERARRYGSPAELAADIRRHLDQEPVLAAPASAAYRARKFAARHRFGVAAGIVGVVGLSAFAATMLVQTARIKREADSKRRVSEFLTQIFQVSDPSEARGNTVTAREILDKGVARVREDLADDPRVRAELMTTMGTVYQSLGLFGEAEPLLREGLETRRRVLGADHPDSLRTASALGRLLLAALRDEEAEALLLATVESQRRVLGPEHPDTLFSMGNLARAYWALDRAKESEALFRQTLPINKRVLGPEHQETLRSMHGLGLAVKSAGRFKEAEAIFHETLALRRRVLGPDHPQTLNTMMHLSFSYENQNRLNEARALLREVLEIGQRVFGPRHPDMLWARINLASWAVSDGRRSEALAYIQDAVDNGFSDTTWLLESGAFKTLQGDPDFQKIVAAAKANQEPPAKSNP